MPDALPVVIFDQWKRCPVYHFHGRWDAAPNGPRLLEGGWKRNQSVTTCRLVTWEMEWLDGAPGTRPTVRKERSLGVTLRRDHADLFARLCKMCARLEGI